MRKYIVAIALGLAAAVGVTAASAMPTKTVTHECVYVQAGHGVSYGDLNVYRKGTQYRLCIVGKRGKRGFRGHVGATGATGAQGVQGIQGIPGETGATGATGAQGLPGQDGTNGKDGSSVTAVLNDDGSISVYQDGELIGTLTSGKDGAAGPQGPAGPAGPTGATGPQGPAGPAGGNGCPGVWELHGQGNDQAYICKSATH